VTLYRRRIDVPEETLSIGELAAAAGTTRRALHHYDKIGLLVPTHRTSSGYRRYGADEARRLSRIQTLAALGMRLGAIAAVLSGNERGGLIDALERRAHQTEAEIASGQRRREGLRQALTALAADGGDVLATVDSLEVSMADSDVQMTIPILAYRDLERAHDHLVDVFGLRPGGIVRDGEGNAVHGEVFALNGSAIWLHRHAPEHGLASPADLELATGGVIVLVDDADEHHRRAVNAGALIDYPPVDQSYGLHEYAARDPEGGRWYFAHRLLDET
jgi:MerR family transcriptional regulator, thiopeptide resistance regulator